MRATASLVVWFSIAFLCSNIRGDIVQVVSVEVDDGSGVLTDRDSITGPPIDRDILAQLFLQNEYSVLSSAGRFGNIGVSATIQEVQGSVNTVVTIRSDEFVNLTPFPQRAVANFIIDGGEFSVTAALGSRVDVKLEVDATSSGILYPFDSEITIEPTYDFGPVVLTTSGDDIGAFVDPNDPYRVELPLSFHSLDLGIVPPGGNLWIFYSLKVQSDMPISPEYVSWSFSDPGNISGYGDFPTVTFTAVPEPSAAIYVFLPLAFALLLCRRSSRIGLS